MEVIKIPKETSGGGSDRYQRINYGSCEVDQAMAGFNTYYNAFVPNRDMSVTRIRFEASILTTSGDMDIGIYNDAGTRLNFGSVAVGVTGFHEVTISSTNLIAGTKYWIGFVGQNGIAGFMTGETSNTGDRVTKLQVISSLPATWTSPIGTSVSVWFQIY